MYESTNSALSPSSSTDIREIDIKLFGDIEITITRLSGEPESVKLPEGMVLQALALLACRRQISNHDIITALWNSAKYDATNLSALLAKLRKWLTGITGESRPLVTQRNQFVLLDEMITSDVLRFRSRLNDGIKKNSLSDVKGAILVYEEGRIRGQLLAGWESTWQWVAHDFIPWDAEKNKVLTVISERNQLEEKYRSAQKYLANNSPIVTPVAEPIISQVPVEKVPISQPIEPVDDSPKDFHDPKQIETKTTKSASPEKSGRTPSPKWFFATIPVFLLVIALAASTYKWKDSSNTAGNPKLDNPPPSIAPNATSVDSETKARIDLLMTEIEKLKAEKSSRSSVAEPTNLPSPPSQITFPQKEGSVDTATNQKIKNLETEIEKLRQASITRSVKPPVKVLNLGSQIQKKPTTSPGNHPSGSGSRPNKKHSSLIEKEVMPNTSENFTVNPSEIARGTGTGGEVGRADIIVGPPSGGGADIQTTKIGTKESTEGGTPVTVASKDKDDRATPGLDKGPSTLGTKVNAIEEADSFEDAKATSKPKAVITDEMKASGDLKSVRVQFTIAPNGSSTFKILSSSGNDAVDAAVSRACAGYRWKPATRGGKPVSTQQIITFDPKD